MPILTFFINPEVGDRFLCPQGAPQNAPPRAPFPTGTKTEQKNNLLLPPGERSRNVGPSLNKKHIFIPMSMPNGKRQGGAFGATPKGWRVKRATPLGFVVFHLALEIRNKKHMEISFLLRPGPTFGPELKTNFGCWPLAIFRVGGKQNYCFRGKSPQPNFGPEIKVLRRLTKKTDYL